MRPCSVVNLPQYVRRVAAAAVMLSTGSCGDQSPRKSPDPQTTSARASSCRRDSLEAILRATLVAMHRRNPVPGLSAALFARADDLSAAAAVGVSSLTTNRALLPSDRFLAGSVGKTFFAALALRAASRGQLNLDEPVAGVIRDSGLAAFHWITPRMLLMHTSGIGEYDTIFMTALVRQPIRERSRDDWLNVIRRSPPNRRAAGTFRYSDMNYVVLALLLDSVVPHGAYASIAREFLTPLGLSATAPSVTPAIAGLVDGYDGAGSMWGRDAMLSNAALIYNPQFEFGGGGFVSTPTDLAKWLAAFRTGLAFPDSLWPAIVARPAGVPDTARSWHGIGVNVGRGSLGLHVGHSGYMPGYASWVRWYDSLGVSIALQTNAADTLRLRDDGFEWLDSIATRVGARCR